MIITKQYKTRIARLVFFAACALLFFIFDFKLLMWICLALVVLPFLIGFVIWIFAKPKESTFKRELNKAVKANKERNWKEFVAKEQKENIKTIDEAGEIMKNFKK